MAAARPLDSAPVLLCGYPKSGTTLLVSLLDGHDDLLVFPEEMRLFRLVELEPREAWLEAVWRRTGVAHLRRGREATKSGPRDYSALDHERYRADVERLFRASDGEPRSLMVALAVAYRDQLRPGFAGTWIEKTPGNERFLRTASDWWPDVRAIQIVRDPRGAFCSYRRKRARSGHPLHLDRFLYDWSAYVDAFDAFARSAPERALRITYEALVRSPESTMRRVAAFLGVEWSPSLLCPTRAGHEWTGNSMYGQTFTGVDPSSADRWQAEIGRAERRVIEHRVADRIEELGFGDRPSSGALTVAAASVAARSGRGVRGSVRMFTRLVSRTPPE